MLFYQDNALAHIGSSQWTLPDCGFTRLDLPPCLPDLAPSDYFLFPNMKKHLPWMHNWLDEEVIAAVKEFFRDQDEGF